MHKLEFCITFPAVLDIFKLLSLFSRMLGADEHVEDFDWEGDDSCRPETIVHYGCFSCQYNHRLGAHKSEYGLKHDLIPHVWTSMIDILLLIHIAGN